MSNNKVTLTTDSIDFLFTSIFPHFKEKDRDEMSKIIDVTRILRKENDEIKEFNKTLREKTEIICKNNSCVIRENSILYSGGDGNKAPEMIKKVKDELDIFEKERIGFMAKKNEIIISNSLYKFLNEIVLKKSIEELIKINNQERKDKNGNPVNISIFTTVFYEKLDELEKQLKDFSIIKEK